MSSNGHTLIIAEAGVNHNGDIELAKQLISSAAYAGADLVKFQTFNAKRIATADAPKAEYQNLTTNKTKSQISILQELELSADMHHVLIDHCKTCKIGFFSTGFDIESIDFLTSIGLEIVKIPSGEITNLPYLSHVGALGKSVIMSTGMATLGEIEAALQILETSGTPRSRITVLHCNTEYPTPVDDVNLQAMLSIRDAFSVAVGYSDHTLGIEVSIAAVAMGATVIEKHLTLDRNLSGPDHKASLEPNEFFSMVQAIRNVEKAMGDGIKRPTNSEAKNKMAVRKSLVAAKSIRVGDCFTADNITTKRPGTGISPMRWNEVIGRTAVRDFQPDDPIVL